MCNKLIYLLTTVLVLVLFAGPAKAETIWVEAEDYDSLTGPLELFKPNLTASGLACLGTDEGRGDSNNDPPAADNGVATYNITVAGGTYKIMGRWKNAGSNSFWWRIATGTSAQITHASAAANCNNWPGSNYWEWADVRDDNTAGDPTVEWVLAAGDHVVEVMRREDGTWLDGFIVTDNLTLDRNTLPDLIIDPTRGTDPGPGDGARKASETVQLTWTAGTTAVGNHKVFFGTDPGSLAQIATPPVGTETADPGTLAYNTDYYWQIIENDGTSDLAGPIWTFRTTPDPAVMADADIIGQWMFEGDFSDSSGHEYNGAEAGSVSIISDPERGQVALFDNSDHPRVEIGDDQIFNPEGDFSISLWANIGSWTGNWANVMISKYGEDNLGWQLRRANSDLFSFTTRSGGDQDCRSDTVPPLDQWVHITVVYDTATSKKRIYFNGVLDIERDGHDRHVRTTHHIMWIGTRSNNRNNNHDRHFTGMLDDIRFYTKALTPEEIADLAVANIASNPDPANGENVSADVQDVTNNLYDILTFTPGKGAISHEAFFSDDIQDVIDRNPANSLGPPPYPGRLPDNGYYVGFVGPNVPAFAQVSLERKQTYYWTVDENDGATTWPGHIWSFTLMTVEAWEPDPADGARFVPADAGVALSWKEGDVVTEGYALSYDVYYGTVKADVETGETPNSNVEDPTHTTDPLPEGTVCYWRVDTVLKDNSPPTPFDEDRIITGKVWQFTTLEEITISDPNLIGWWKLNGNVIDWSGHGNDGIANGDPQYVPGPVVDEAMDFDSVDDFIDLNDKMLEGTLTVALWLQWDGHTGSYNSIMHNNAWNSGSLHLHLRNDGDMNPEINNVGNLRANTPLTVGQWYHFATVFDMDAMVARLYLDGAQDHQITLTGAGIPYIGPMNIGAYQESSRYFDGRMSDWRLYDRALSQAEIAHIMDVRKAWNPSPADGQRDVPLSSNLTWNAGTDPDTGSEYTRHDVYFGTNFDDVNSGTVPTATVTGINEHTPTFDYYVTCYWRVDGINASDETCKGNVWTFKATYNPALIVDANLVGWWKLDGDPTDSSGYGKHGTENGNPGYVTGYEGQAIELDGDDYVNIDGYKGINADRTDPDNPVQQPFSVACWIKTTGNAALVTWGSSDGTGVGGQYQSFRIDGGRLRAEHGNGNLRGNTYVNDGEWHHVALTSVEGANLRVPQNILYVDAVEDTVFSGSDNIYNVTADADVSIGRRASHGDRYFTGLIDDVRIYDYALSPEKIVEVMRINLAWAWNPNPANGATGVGTEPTLSWKPGDYAPLTEGHYVYYGADDPANLDLVASQPQSPNNYSPGALDLDRTYYWAVDEANGAAGDVDPGKIWSFTTIDYLVIDDMETYTIWTTPDNNIFEVWVDGSGDCNAILGNGTGSLLGLETTISYPDGFEHSMKVEYDNDGIANNFCTKVDETRLTYSMVKAEVANLPSGIASDWTAAGAEALVLQFYGSTGNAIEPMWVELTDGSGGKATATYGDYADEDPCDIDKTSWHQWNINLQDFADGGVTLNDVNSIAIGIGDPDATEPGGSGLIYFDDIRLYAPRCILSRRDADFALVDYAPEGDPGGDCLIDYKELDVMSRDWLEYDFNAEPVEPNADGLVAWYELENDANDSSPNGHDGTEMGGPTYVVGYDGQAISLDGSDDYVDIGYSPELSLNEFTVSAWVNIATEPGTFGVLGTRFGGDNTFDFKVRSTDVHADVGNGSSWIDTNVDIRATDTGSTGQGGDLAVDTWYMITYVIDNTNQQVRLYLDADLKRTIDVSGIPLLMKAGQSMRIGNSSGGEWMNGLIDEVRIYDYALSQNEIVSVRGLGTLYVPVTSPANISDDEPVTGKKVNFLDYAVLTQRWLEEDMFP